MKTMLSKALVLTVIVLFIGAAVMPAINGYFEEIEFQSTVDKFMSVRILRYLMEFYEYISKQKGIKKLPAIFPLLLYNGDKKWTAKTNIKDLISKSIPEKYIPNFSYYKIIENEIPRETLLKIHNAVSAIFYVEGSNPEELSKNFRDVLKLLEQEQPEILRLFRNWLNNLFGNKDTELTDQIEDLLEVKSMFETALKQQQKKWTEQGIEQGELLEKQNVLIKQLSRKFDINEKDKNVIKDNTDFDSLDRALEEILFAQTKEEVLSIIKYYGGQVFY